MSTITKTTVALLFFYCTLAAQADNLREANRLLRVTDIGERFEARAAQQANDIIRTYNSIISMAIDVSLPIRIRRSIAKCYAEVYAWENFQAGVAIILSESLSQKELELLVDFYSHRGLPPTEIDTFKELIEKAEVIERALNNYLYSAANSCVEQDAAIILDYLAASAGYSAGDVVAQ